MPRTRVEWLRWICDGSPVLVSLFNALSWAYPSEQRFLVVVPTQPLIFLRVVNMLRLMGFNTEAMLPRQSVARKNQLLSSFSKKKSPMHVLVTRLEEASGYFYTLACNTALSTYIPSSGPLLKQLTDLMMRPWKPGKGDTKQARMLFYPVQMTDDDAKCRLLWTSFAQGIFKENPAVARIRGALGRMAAYEIARLCCGAQQEHMGWLELQDRSGQPISMTYDTATANDTTEANNTAETIDTAATGFSYFENELPIQDPEFQKLLEDFDLEKMDPIGQADVQELMDDFTLEKTATYENITMTDLVGGFCAFQACEDWDIVTLSWIVENAKEQFIDTTKLPLAFHQLGDGGGEEERHDPQPGQKTGQKPGRKPGKKRGRPQKGQASKRRKP